MSAYKLFFGNCLVFERDFERLKACESGWKSLELTVNVWEDLCLAKSKTKRPFLMKL